MADGIKKGKLWFGYILWLIGTLLYLQQLDPGLQFAICMCARYQARPTEKHLNAIKRIFRYLKGTVHRGLWYLKDSFIAQITALEMRIMLVVKIHAVAHLVFRMSCVLRIFRLYTSRLLDAACTSALNLLKKRLLVRGKLRQLPNGDYRDGLQIADMDKMTFQNRRDLPRDIPLDSVVVLRYEKRSKSENKGKVPTEMELVLEQTQQGTSYEVSVSAEGVEELKRKVKIKGEKKEALLTLRQKPVKELQEICIIKAFKLSYQEKYEHVGPKSQDHKMARLQDDVKRLCLVDDLKKFKITFISSQRYKSKPKVKDHYNISQVND
ncbi:hypothetical protein Tco_1112401 [Tanacetum coccineum]|uniref:Uncharacterized protein n=1 Tax=Tanacetum coccineum TaxID=301880 RepID=A0ABQ5IPF7_9ASTR